MFSNKFMFSSPSFWQSSLWKDILLESGQCIKSEYIPLNHSRKYLIEVREVGLGFHGAFIIGYSGDFGEEETQSASHYARNEGCIFFQVECLHGSIGTGTIPYKHFLEPFTRVIDLTLSESEILAGMHEKGRYNIRLAQKRGVTTLWVLPTDENIDIWMLLIEDTTSRDIFSHNSRQYYKTFLDILSKNNAGGLLFAYFDGKVIAAGIFVYQKENAIYYYGASISDRELRKHMAPYLLQWQAILEGKMRDCKVYDFLGIADPKDPSSHLRGVTEFKEKFGGSIEKLGDKKIFPLSWKYYVFITIRRLRKITSR